MDFDYSDEQRMLADSVQRLVSQHWGMAQRRERAARSTLDPQVWQALAGLGVLGLNIPQEYGGFGEPADSLLPVHLELGRGLVAEPVIPSAVMASAMLQVCEPAAQASWLPGIATGEIVATVAYQEPGRRYAVLPQDCHAAPEGEGWLLNGVKTLVWHGAAADLMLLTARGPQGQTLLFALPASASGLQRLDTPTLDRSRCARLQLDRVVLPAQALLARGEAADQALERALAWGIAALCAHGAGAMSRLLELTLDYVKTRRQFGQPLAAFQVVQHRMADMLVAKEMALSMAYVAVAALKQSDPRERRRGIAAAKLQLARSGREIGQAAVQLHGGMGMTDELEVGDFFKRLTMLDALFGDTAEQLAQWEELA